MLNFWHPLKFSAVETKISLASPQPWTSLPGKAGKKLPHHPPRVCLTCELKFLSLASLMAGENFFSTFSIRTHLSVHGARPAARWCHGVSWPDRPVTEGVFLLSLHIPWMKSKTSESPNRGTKVHITHLIIPVKLNSTSLWCHLNVLKCSMFLTLEDRGTWHAAVHGVATWLSDWITTKSEVIFPLTIKQEALASLHRVWDAPKGKGEGFVLPLSAPAFSFRYPDSLTLKKFSPMHLWSSLGNAFHSMQTLLSPHPQGISNKAFCVRDFSWRFVENKETTAQFRTGNYLNFLKRYVWMSKV